MSNKVTLTDNEQKIVDQCKVVNRALTKYVASASEIDWGSQPYNDFGWSQAVTELEHRMNYEHRAAAIEVAVGVEIYNVTYSTTAHTIERARAYRSRYNY